MKEKFIVELDVPEGASVDDCVQYIMDAVGTWHGSLRPAMAYDDDDPGDPMRYLDSDTVRVSRMTP